VIGQGFQQLRQPWVATSKDRQKQLQRTIAIAAIDDLIALWKDGADPSILQMLRSVARFRRLRLRFLPTLGNEPKILAPAI
jgi:hypothetical protein